MTVWRRRARRGEAALGIGCAAATVVVLVLVSTGSPARTPAANADARVGGATTVQRRNLVQTDTQTGTISYAGAATVYNRLGGTITWLPAAGQLIKPGQALFRVDNQPVILLNGTTPAFRNLTPSDAAGPDITELNRNLVALGFNASEIVVDDVWQAATTAGVDLLQASLGETETGSLALGDVVFLPGPRLVASVSGTVGATSASGHPNNSPEFVSLTTTTIPHHAHRVPAGSGSHPPTSGSHAPAPPAAGSGSNAELQAIIALLRAEIAALRANHNPPSSPSPGSSTPHPSSPSSGTPSSGTPSRGGSSPAAPIMSTTSDDLVVTVNLPAASQSEATVGEKVSVELPAGSSVSGVITHVSAVAQSANSDSGPGGGGGGSGAQTVPVTIKLLGRISGAGLDQASVSVNFAQAKATNVLSVPVTALLATSGATYAVQEAAAPHRLIPVTVGLFAAGYVQISGPGLYPGLQVTDSQG